MTIVQLPPFDLRVIYDWMRPETGEYVEAPEPTGMWVCEVRLMEPDAELAAIAIGGTHALV